MLGGGAVSHPLQRTTGLVIKSVTTSPTLAGDRMLFILQVSILSEQIYIMHLLPSDELAVFMKGERAGIRVWYSSPRPRK